MRTHSLICSAKPGNILTTFFWMPPPVWMPASVWYPAQPTGFLLVTGAGPAAVRDAARVGELLELKGKTDVRMVVNRVNKTMMSLLKLTIDDVMDRAGLSLIGIVLEDSDVPLAAACNLPLIRFNKRSGAVTAYKKIAKRIQGFSEPITLR